MARVLIIGLLQFSYLFCVGQECGPNDVRTISMIYGMAWGQPDRIESIFYRNSNFSPEIMLPVLECGSLISDQLLKNQFEGPSNDQIFLTVKSLTDDNGVPELATVIMNNSEALFNSKATGQYINELITMFPDLAKGNSTEFVKSNLFKTSNTALESLRMSNPEMEEQYKQVIYFVQFWYSSYMLSKFN